MSRFKIIALYLAIIFFYSCGGVQRTVEVQKTKILQTNEIERKSPGAKVFVALPLKPKDRPRGESKVYTGEKGAQSIVTFNDAGLVTNILTICPEIDEKEKQIVELEEKVKHIERKRSPWTYFLTGFLIGLILPFIIKKVAKGRFNIFG